MTQFDQQPSKKQIAEFSRKYRIRKISVLKAILVDMFGPSTDLNAIVEFESGCVPGFLALARMEREFSNLVGGRKAGFLTLEDLDRYAPRDVLGSAEVYYEA